MRARGGSWFEDDLGTTLKAWYSKRRLASITYGVLKRHRGCLEPYFYQPDNCEIKCWWKERKLIQVAEASAQVRQNSGGGKTALIKKQRHQIRWRPEFSTVAESCMWVGVHITYPEQREPGSLGRNSGESFNSLLSSSWTSATLLSSHHELKKRNTKEIWRFHKDKIKSYDEEFPFFWANTNSSHPQANARTVVAKQLFK